MISWVREARLSEDGYYRYFLKRTRPDLTQGGSIIFVMLNPSTANSNVDDATIRRCQAFTFRERKRTLVVLNLFAGRATEPADLWKMTDPVGDPINWHTWDGVARFADRKKDIVIFAWGAIPKPVKYRDLFMQQVEKAEALFLNEHRLSCYCLGTTKTGSPRHPLYVKEDQELIPWM